MVDLGAGRDLPASAAGEAAERTLESLPCPTIGIGAEPESPAGERLRDRFDVLLASRAELPPLVQAIERHPLAALALVQLLRLGADLGTGAGLVAESLVYSTLQSGPEFSAWLATRNPPRPHAEESEPAVLSAREGDRLQLTLNRPRKRNAFSVAMRDALVEALGLVLADASIREVVLRGAGPAFCAGGDLDEFGSFPDPATAHAVRSMRSPARLLARCADRVRVEVHGACVGAGIELPAFARRIVATEDAFFELPEVGLGLVPGAGGTVSLPRRIGRQRTAWMALSGARIDARTALAWGLVDEIVTRPAPPEP